jgi:tetratricopeptide (TPR) repeat protein
MTCRGRFPLALSAALTGLLLGSCSRVKRPKAAVPTAYEQELARKKVEVVVQARQRAEQTDRLQALQAVAAREEKSLKSRARDFTVHWQTFFAKRAKKKRIQEEQAREEMARLPARDREAVNAILDKLKAGRPLAAGEEDFALDKVSLERPFGNYLLDQVREFPARKSLLSQIPRYRELLDAAAEDQRLDRSEEKARADLAAFAAQVQQMTAAAQRVRESDMEAAAAGLTVAVEKSPFVPEFFALRGAIQCLALQDLDRAIADLDEANRLDPSDAWVWYCRGVAYWLKGSHAPARADFQMAVKTDPALAALVRDIDPATP